MRHSIDLSRDKEGELYQQQAAFQSKLKWSTLDSDILIKGISEQTSLNNIKNAIIALQDRFNSESGPRIIIEGNQLDDFQKRFLLIESQVEGLMKRRIQYSAGDKNSGQRFLDYGSLLNQKQNQIVELEKKINNLEQRLRRASARELQLQNEIVSLNQKLIIKDGIIHSKNQVILAQVSATNAMKQTMARLKRNLDINRSKISQDISQIVLDGVIIPEIGTFDIKADALTKEGAQGRSQTYSQSSQGQRIKTKVIQMIRQFERLFQKNQQVAKEDIQRVIQGFLIELQGTHLYENVQTSIRRNHIEEQLKRLRQNFAVAAGIYQSSVQKMKLDNPNISINLERNLFDILQRQNVKAYKTEGSAVFVNDYSQRTIEVPVQDARTKHLLHLFASELKRLFNKYPKLHGQLDERIVQFFQQQIIDCIEVDQVDRLVQIVKYQPQVVKVQNVYAYSSQKSRKVEFHLRVLVKALLEQLEKLKMKSGQVLEMDEGILAMIKQEIMGVVDVDDILKVFKVVPKIDQVEKIVEKIVQKLVQVPKIITVDRIVQKIIQVEKIKEIDKVVNVPLEQPMVVDRCIQKVVPLSNTIQKVVQVPVIREKIVEVLRQVPKIEQVQKIEEKIVQVDRVVQVQRVVNHIQKQIQEIEVIHQKIVPTQKIIEKIVEVPVIVEKIVEVIKEVPKIIEVQKIVEKCVPIIEYQNAREVQNHIEIQHNIVERIVEKPIPIIQIVQKIVQVPQIVQKIVQITNTVTQIVEKEVIVQKIVIQQRIKEIQKINTQTIEVIKQVPVQIEKIIQIPLMYEKIKIVQEFIEKPCIERITQTIIQEVYLRDPLVIKEPKIIEVQKIVNHYIEVPKPVKYIEQKIVQVEKIVDRIKEVRVEIDKLVQKMVEVPKVVEVQKIVQKIVVVPRVVEKVVEVPQIVQKAVEKQIIKQVIRQVQRKVEVPVFQDRVIEVEVQKNIFIQVQKAVDRFVDKLVEVPKIEQIVQIKEIIQQKIIQVIREVPVNLETQKIVTLYADNVKLIEIERPIIVPAQIPVPVDRIVQKLVIKEDIREKVVQVPQVIQKIVTVKEQEVIVQQIEKLVQKVVVDTKIKQVQKIVPYIQEVIKQIPNVIEKIVPVYYKVEQIVATQQIIEKIVQKTNTIPQIYEVQRLREKVVEVPQFCEIQKIVPQLVRVNNYIQNVVEKIVQVPVIVQQLRQIQKQVEKVVKVESEVEKIVEVERNIEKVVIMQKLKQVVRDVNYIEQVLHIVQKIQQIPTQILIREQVLVEVPYILEKIVQKIVVMPQIVQVLKYVHQICQSQQLGVAVDVDVSVHQQKYKQLSRDIKGQLDILLRQIRGIKQSNPKLKDTIVIIEKFLAQFEKYVMTPRIVKTIEERVQNNTVEVDKIIKVPTDSQRSIRMQLTLSLLVEKLILELKRIKQTTNVNFELDQDIKLIFFSDLNTRSQLEGELSGKFQSYSQKIMRNFESLGNWTLDHQLMLNSFLQQRFMMAEIVQEANLKIDQANRTSQQRLEALRRYKKDKNQFQGLLVSIRNEMQKCNPQIKSELGGLLNIVSKFSTYDNLGAQQPVKYLGQVVLQERISSMFRQKDEQIFRLRDLVAKYGAQTRIQGSQEEFRRLKMENAELRAKISAMQNQVSESSIQLIVSSIKQQLKQLQNVNFELQSQNSSLISQIINLQAQNRTLRSLTGDASSRLSEHQIFTQGSPIKSQFQRGFHLSTDNKDLRKQQGLQGGSTVQASTIGVGDNNKNIVQSPQRIKRSDKIPESTAYRYQNSQGGATGRYQSTGQRNIQTPGRQGGDYRQWSSNQQQLSETTPIRQIQSKTFGTDKQPNSQYNLSAQQSQSGELNQSRHSVQSGYSGLSASQYKEAGFRQQSGQVQGQSQQGAYNQGQGGQYYTQSQSQQGQLRQSSYTQGQSSYAQGQSGYTQGQGIDSRYSQSQATRYQPGQQQDISSSQARSQTSSQQGQTSYRYGGDSRTYRRQQPKKE